MKEKNDLMVSQLFKIIRDLEDIIDSIANLIESYNDSDSEYEILCERHKNPATDLRFGKFVCEDCMQELKDQFLS